MDESNGSSGSPASLRFCRPTTPAPRRSAPSRPLIRWIKPARTGGDRGWQPPLPPEAMEVGLRDEQALAQGDELASTLDRVADAAEDQARVQAQVARAARGAARERYDGARSEASTKRVRDVLDLVSAGTERMVSAAGDLRRVWAATLAA